MASQVGDLRLCCEEGGGAGCADCDLVLERVRCGKDRVLRPIGDDGCLQALLTERIVDVHHDAVLRRSSVGDRDRTEVPMEARGEAAQLRHIAAMQDSLKLLWAGQRRGVEGRKEYVRHVTAIARDAVRHKSARLIDHCQGPHRRLVELLRLLCDRVDVSESPTDGTLDHPEDLIEYAEDAGVGLRGQSEDRAQHKCSYRQRSSEPPWIWPAGLLIPCLYRSWL